jgi:hypothetical protein
MKEKLPKFILNRRLEAAIVVVFFLILFKFLFPTQENLFSISVTEILVFLSLFLSVIYTNTFTKRKREQPVSLLINSGILAAVLFFLIALSSTMFDALPKLSSSITFIYTSISLLISCTFLAFVTYIFAALRDFIFYVRKKKLINLMMP